MKNRLVWVTWTVVLVLAGSGLILGFLGFWIEHPPGEGRPAGFRFSVIAGILDNVWRTFALFVMQADVVPHDNWFLVLARILLPAATLGAIYRLCAGYIAMRLNERGMSRMRDHTVLIGCGSQGCLFLQTSTGPVTVLDISDSALPENRTDVVAYVHRGDGCNLDTLRLAGVPDARTVLILTGSDTLNLEIMNEVLLCRGNSRKSLSVVVRVRNRVLARQLEREDEFVRPGLGNGPPAREDDVPIEITPFNADRVAAWQLLRDYPLVDLADLRGQPRVHMILMGWTGFAFEVMEQLTRLASYRDFDLPRVDLFVPHPERVLSELAAVQPAFLSGMVQEATAQQPAGPCPEAEPCPYLRFIFIFLTTRAVYPRLCRCSPSNLGSTRA